MRAKYRSDANRARENLCAFRPLGSGHNILMPRCYRSADEPLFRVHCNLMLVRLINLDERKYFNCPAPLCVTLMGVCIGIEFDLLGFSPKEHPFRDTFTLCNLLVRDVCADIVLSLCVLPNRIPFRRKRKKQRKLPGHWARLSLYTVLRSQAMLHRTSQQLYARRGMGGCIGLAKSTPKKRPPRGGSEPPSWTYPAWFRQLGGSGPHLLGRQKQQLCRWKKGTPKLRSPGLGSPTWGFNFSI